MVRIRQEGGGGWRDDSQASFEELALPLFDSLYNFAYWLARDRTEAEDLVQETYLKALRSFSSFQPGTNFRAWIFRILRNTFFTSRSRSSVTRTLPLELDEDWQDLIVEEETPERILLQDCDSQLVRSALEALPVHYREILVLCDVEEMSYREIAVTLSIPLGTATSRVWRARHSLRASLQMTAQGGGRPLKIFSGKHFGQQTPGAPGSPAAIAG